MKGTFEASRMTIFCLALLIKLPKRHGRSWLPAVAHGDFQQRRSTAALVHDGETRGNNIHSIRCRPDGANRVMLESPCTSTSKSVYPTWNHCPFPLDGVHAPSLIRPLLLAHLRRRRPFRLGRLARSTIDVDEVVTDDGWGRLCDMSIVHSDASSGPLPAATPASPGGGGSGRGCGGGGRRFDLSVASRHISDVVAGYRCSSARSNGIAASRDLCCASVCTGSARGEGSGATARASTRGRSSSDRARSRTGAGTRGARGRGRISRTRRRGSLVGSRGLRAPVRVVARQLVEQDASETDFLIQGR